MTTDQNVVRDDTYDASHITALEETEAVRLRPGMYIGPTDINGLHHMIREVVDNSVDEALAGHANHITITILNDASVRVTDNGRGIPVDVHPKHNVSALELAATKLHAGGKFGQGGYKVSSGLHGVGLSVVNALSEWMRIEVKRHNQLWVQEYRAGKPQGAVRAVGAAEGTGTSIHFLPDVLIFKEGLDYTFRVLAQRFREMAYLTKGLRFHFVDERTGQEVNFYFEGGVISYVRHLNKDKNVLHRQPFYVERTSDDVAVEIAMQYTETYDTDSVYTFANNINNTDGGAHLTGFRTALTRVINTYARAKGMLKENETNLTGDDVREGLTAVISVKLRDPQFSSQTKEKLVSPEAASAVATVVGDTFAAWLDENPGEARRIIEKAISAARTRLAVQKVRETARKSAMEGFSLPGKLADCSDTNPARCELYIVEGDSAGGCLGAETGIPLASGLVKTMRELAQDWEQGIHHFGYATNDEGDIRVVPLLEPRLTKQQAPLVEVVLDNGERIHCTFDHPFRLRDGSYCAAGELQPGVSLMSFKTRLTNAEELPGPTHVNCKVVAVRQLEERADVYDLTVDGYHNFALASGIFVHNSAKQGRDRRFQAILPLRGKILNVEKSRLDKMLSNAEVKAMITAIGTAIGEQFSTDKLRYHRILLMSVAGDEPTLVSDENGCTELVKIGDFIDDCIEGRRITERYSVVSFDHATHTTRFRPLKAVIRHSHEEALYRITTRYNRSIKVTASHSVFVFEDGQVRLKRGNAVQPGDLLVASRCLPRPATSPTQIDLLETLYRTGQTEGLYLQGEDVRKIASQRVMDNVARPELWSEPRVVLNSAEWQQLVAHRQATGLSQMQVATAVGVQQPITVSHWERGINRPILSHFNDYLDAIGWHAQLDYTLLPAKIDERLAQDDNSQTARWREVSAYKPFASFTPEEVAQLGAAVQIVPRAHSRRAFGRYLPITRDLVWLLGWYAAEGTLSAHQVSLNLGQKDVRFIPELSIAIQAVCGEVPRQYHDPDSDGIKLYFHSVAIARLLQAWGLTGCAHTKRVPNMLFSLPEELQLAFLEGYFLGDGTISGTTIKFTTSAPDLKDGLLYMLGQLGLVATTTEMPPGTAPDAPIQTRHPYYTIALGGKEQLERCRPIWQRHANAPHLANHLLRPTRNAPAYVPIGADLIGLEVMATEEVAPVGEYVYDFSVQDDENFVCGTGGLYAHNTDADVDGSHIRTLLLTFFFRYMRPLIVNGHLYIAQPPLYRLKHGKQQVYVYSDTEKDDYIARLPEGTKVDVQRYKGLGEMNPDQLWETTMNPTNRVILQVTLEDAQQADETFTMLMGDMVPPRRKFIQAHASEVRNLDI